MYVINGSLHESSCSAELSCQTVNQEMPAGTGYGPGVNVLPRLMAKRSNGGSGSASEAARAVARDQKQGVTTFKNKKHIYIERQRRIYMNTLLESLQALLPDPRPRKDRCTLLSEVTDYLRSLEGSLKELAIRKAEIMAALAQGGGQIIKLNNEAQAADHEGAVAAASVSLQPCLRNVRVQEIKSGGSTTNPLANPIEEVIITFVSPCVNGLWSQILFLFHKHQIDIITATLSTTTTDAQVLHYIHARVPKQLGLQNDDIKEILCSFVQSVE